MPILNMIYGASGGRKWKPGANTVAYYPFDTNFNDYSGNGYDLTNNGGVTIESVNGVTCANFKNQSPYGLSRTAGSIIASGPYTFLAWMNMDLSSGTSNPRMFGGKSNWFVMWNRENGGGVYPGYGSNTGVPYSAGWHLVCIVGDSSDGSYDSYKDGVYLNSGTGTTGSRTGLVLGTNESNFSSLLDKFIGQMSKVIFENKQRTAQEVLGYYNLTKSNYGHKIDYIITGSTTVGSYTPPQFSDLQGFFMSPDGLNAYATFWNNGNGRMVQYSLSTARNISTASQVRYISLAKPNGFCFSNDGVYMFYSTETDNSIKRYTLSTPRDISTAVQDSGQSLSSTGRFAFNVCITENGEYIYFSPDVSRKLYQYQLTTPYDLTTATNQKILSTTQRSASAAVVNTGKYLLLAGPDGEAIKQYELSTPYDITSTLTEVGSCSISYGEARAFYVSDDCKYWAIGNTSNGITQYEAQPIS